MKTSFNCFLFLFMTIILSTTIWAASPSDRIVDAGYEITGEVHLKGVDTLLVTNDTIKFFTPAKRFITGLDWNLITAKVRPVNGTGDSIRIQLKLIAFDDSSNYIGEKIIDTISDSLGRSVRIPYNLIPASRYALYGLPIAATFKNGVYIQRAKLVYGRPVVYTR